MVTIAELGKHVGKEVKLAGWLYNSRSSGKLVFLVIRDGTGLCQCVVFSGNVNPEIFAKANSLTQEASFSVVGTVKENPKQPGVYELDVKELEALGESVDYPISPKDHGVGFLMANRHLWLRSTKQWATLRVRAQVIKSTREFLESQGYINIDAPCLTPTACEGTTTLFETDYFGKPAFLSQSGQLYNEAAAAAFGKVYCFGPVFRAEKSKTRRHLIEFWQVEPEAAFVDHIENMKVQENMVEYIVKSVLKNCATELKAIERDTSKLEKIITPFPRITYTEAVKVLQEKGSEIVWGSDFGAPDETIISEMYDRPVMIEKYPAQVKAFYMKQDPENPKVVLCDDMIAPEGVGEIIGASQREDNLDILIRKIKEHGYGTESFEWYLDLRRYGTFVHSGFGMGIERMTGWLANAEHVRETVPFPRLLDHIYP
ncbi:MAG: asparagine--tRNA ligase [Caldisericia bacterium]|nr:asparagine--tRNA ligase [Caldisericia bacterium]